MNGLNELGSDDPNYVGFDYMSLVKGAGGFLSGFGGGGGDDKGAAEKARQEEARRRAEQSATTMKMLLVGLLAAVGVGGVVFLVGRK